MRITQSFLTLYVSSWVALLMSGGCVTQTERIYPHERIPADESVWDELRREFGWQNSNTTRRIVEPPTEPFYKRAAQGVKETVSGWFREDPVAAPDGELEADRRRFEQKRAEALRQLREQQEEEE